MLRIMEDKYKCDKMSCGWQAEYTLQNKSLTFFQYKK